MAVVSVHDVVAHGNSAARVRALSGASLQEGKLDGRFVEFALLVPVLAFSAWAFRWWLVDGALPLTGEHGLMENIQQALLVPVFLLFLDAYRKGYGSFRVASGALTLLAAAGTVREIEVKSFGGPEWYQWISHHGLQEVLFIGLLLPIGFYFYAQRAYLVEMLGLALRVRAWPIYVAAMFLAAGIVLDELIVHSNAMRFWEEMVETYGYVFLLLAAWRHHHLIGDPGFNRG